ncbi:hypothetical protein MKK88_09780 [Methylobacterium sp. E-005]|nr:hypothetical protein [Methylobacterium sp. E-005]
MSVGVMAARGRREPLRMHSELDSEDEDLFLGAVGPRESPIDRSAQVLDQRPPDPHVLDLEASELEPIRALTRPVRDERARRDPPESGR